MQMLIVCPTYVPLKVSNDSMDEVDIFNLAQVEALPTTTEQVATATKKDPLLSQVYRYTQSGWPNEVNDVLLSFWNHQI